MATRLNKRVKRLTEATIREAGKTRRNVVTLYPSGVIGLRPEKTRREELIAIDTVWRTAVRNRVAVERMEKAKKRKAKKR